MMKEDISRKYLEMSTTADRGEETMPRPSKKKATNSFKNYIRNVLTDDNPDGRISAEASEQIDGFIKILAHRIFQIANETCVNTGKATIKQREIELAVSLLFPPDLASAAKAEMRKACDNMEQHKLQKEEERDPDEERAAPVRREKQAGIKFPVALTEKFLKNFGTSKLNVAKPSPVALAAALEYITSEILTLANDEEILGKKKTIKPRHVMLAIAGDKDLKALQENLGIIFLGGGIEPHIAEGLIPTEKKKQAALRRRRKAQKNRTSDGTKRPHKYLPGTKSLMEINRLQKTTELLLRKQPFSRDVKAIAQLINEEEDEEDRLRDIKYGKDVILAIQHFVEHKAACIFRKAVKSSLRAGRETVARDDIEMVWEFDNTFPAIVDDEGNRMAVDQIGNNGIGRIGKRGGVKRKASQAETSMTQTMREYIYAVIYHTMRQTLLHVKHRKVITASVKDVTEGLRQLGVNLLVPSKIPS